MEEYCKSCFEKQRQVIELFRSCGDEEAKYTKIIELGRSQRPLGIQYKVADNIVPGCQSTMYLRSYKDAESGLIFFEGESNALISSGLAALLISVYSGQRAEAILKCPPDYLEELGINASISPSRANGLYSIHLRMKQDALKWLLH